MKIILFLIGVTILSVSASYAQQRNANPTPGGASEYSPGDQLKDQGGPKPGTRGASEFAPGDRKKDSGATTEGKGASEFSPGDRAKDRPAAGDKR